MLLFSKYSSGRKNFIYLIKYTKVINKKLKDLLIFCNFQKGEIIHIISKKATGLWTGKVRNQVGHFKFINVQMLPEDDQEDDDNDDDAPGDYASNYPCCDSCDHLLSSSATPETLGGDNQQVICQHHRNNHLLNHSPKNRYLTDSHHGGQKKNSKRSKDSVPLSSWEMEERQNIANVMNGESRILEMDSVDDQTKSGSTRMRRKSGLNQPGEEEECQSSKILRGSNNNLGKETSNETPRAKKKSSLKKGRPKSVSDLLDRINLNVSDDLFY